MPIRFISAFACIASFLAGPPLEDPFLQEERVTEEGFVTTSDGLNIYYRVLGGDGDTAVVVHGGPGAGMGSILPHLAPLSDSLTLIFYDQRGGGRSSLPEDRSLLSPQGFVSDLEAVQRHFDLERMDLIAHSFGAVIVAEYLRDHPDGMDRLVLLGATGPSRAAAAAQAEGDDATGGRKATPTAQTEVAEALEALLAGTSENPVADCRRYESGRDPAQESSWKGTSCDMPSEAIRYYYQYTAQLGPERFGDWDYTGGKLAEVRAPVLVIHGGRDRESRQNQIAWASAFPEGRLWVVPGAGRTAIADEPHWVLGGILRFLRE